MAASTSTRGIPTSWECGWCGGSVTDETALLDHQEWCLGDGVANTRMLTEVVTRDGELTHEALVAAARSYRLAAEATELPPD